MTRIRGLSKQTSSFIFVFCLAFPLSAPMCASATSNLLPNGPGKQETIEICGKCHAPERSAALHQSRRGWEITIAKMVSMGAEGSDEQLNAVLDYLSKNFPPPPPAPININTATPIEMESTLLLLRTEAAAVVRYRREHGPLKSLDDLRNVPGLDFQKIENNKARIVF